MAPCGQKYAPQPAVEVNEVISSVIVGVGDTGVKPLVYGINYGPLQNRSNSGFWGNQKWNLRSPKQKSETTFIY